MWGRGWRGRGTSGVAHGAQTGGGPWTGRTRSRRPPRHDAGGPERRECPPRTNRSFASGAPSGQAPKVAQPLRHELERGPPVRDVRPLQRAVRSAVRNGRRSGPAPQAPRAHRTLPPSAASGWVLGRTPLPTRRGWLHAHPRPRARCALNDGWAAGAPCGAVRPAGTRRLDLSAEESQAQDEDEYGAGRARPTPERPPRPSREPSLATAVARAHAVPLCTKQTATTRCLARTGARRRLAREGQEARATASAPACPLLCWVCTRAGGEEEPDAVAAGPLPPLPSPTLARPQAAPARHPCEACAGVHSQWRVAPRWWPRGAQRVGEWATVRARRPLSEAVTQLQR